MALRNYLNRYCGIAVLSAAVSLPSLADVKPLQDEMRSVSVDEFVNGFILHCLGNTNKIEKFERLLEYLVEEDFAFEADPEIAKVFVDSDHVVDQRVWVLLSGLGSPAFVGLYDAKIFGTDSRGCSFGNTRMQSDGVIEDLLGKIPSLDLIKDADNDVRYEVMFRHNPADGRSVQLIRLGFSNIKSIPGVVIEVYWPNI